MATPLSRGAGVLTSLVRADGLLVVPAATEGHQAGRAGRGRAAARAGRDPADDRGDRVARPGAGPGRLAAARPRPADQPRLVQRGLARRAGGPAGRAVPPGRLPPARPGDGRATRCRTSTGCSRAGGSASSGWSTGSRASSSARQPARPGRHHGPHQAGRPLREPAARRRHEGAAGLRARRGAGRRRAPSTATRARSTPTSRWPLPWPSGRADCGLGILAAARAFGLDFVPVTHGALRPRRRRRPARRPAARPLLGAAPVGGLPGVGREPGRLLHRRDGPADPVAGRGRPRERWSDSDSRCAVSGHPGQEGRRSSAAADGRTVTVTWSPSAGGGRSHGTCAVRGAGPRSSTRQ